MGTNWLRLGGQLPCPILFYLDVSNFSECMEDFLALLLKPVPARAWIGLGERFRHRPATPERYAQIVDVVDIPGFADLLRALQHAVHPLFQAGLTIGIRRG